MLVPEPVRKYATVVAAITGQQGLTKPTKEIYAAARRYDSTVDLPTVDQLLILQTIQTILAAGSLDTFLRDTELYTSEELLEERMQASAAVSVIAKTLTPICSDMRIKYTEGAHLYKRSNILSSLALVMGKSTRRSCILLGPPGCGKTSLAYSASQVDASHPLYGYAFLELNIDLFIAGTRHHGDLEERANLLVESVPPNSNVILFIDRMSRMFDEMSSPSIFSIIEPRLESLTLLGCMSNRQYHSVLKRIPSVSNAFTILRVPVLEPEEQEAVLASHIARIGCVTTPSVLAEVERLGVNYLGHVPQPKRSIDILELATAANTGISPDSVRAAVETIANRKLIGEDDSTILNLPSIIGKRLVGQDTAIAQITDKLITSIARMQRKRDDRPLGVFFLLGPTGVGKTFLAKVLSDIMFGGNLIREDMGAYSSSAAASRLHGAAPQYVGFGQGTPLLNAVREHPNAVVLLDEIEKAHPIVYNTLLTLMDEGYMEDDLGPVDFSNTVVVLTSNVGVSSNGEYASKNLGFGDKLGENQNQRMQRSILEDFKKIFPPEFVNRIDNIITFSALTRDVRRDILYMELAKVAEEMGTEIELAPDLVEKMLDNCPQEYGARPIRREIMKVVEVPLARESLSNKNHFTRNRYVFRDYGSYQAGETT